jgi:DNA primase
MGAREVIVVEGLFDAPAVHQAGYPAVVALKGSTLSARQADLLTSHSDGAVVMLDGDEARRQGTTMIAQVLGSRMPIFTTTLENGAQLDQLSRCTIGSLVESHEHVATTAGDRNSPAGDLV